MNLCSDCPCDCQCLYQTKTEVILYPIPNPKKLDKRKSMPNHFNTKRSLFQLNQSFNINSSMVSSKVISRLAEVEDIEGIQKKLRMTIDTITRIGSVSSKNIRKSNKSKSKDRTCFEQHENGNIGQSKETVKFIRKRNQSVHISYGKDQKTNFNKENQEDKQNSQTHNWEIKKKQKKSKNFVVEDLETKRGFISPSCSQLPSLRNSILHETNKSYILSPKQQDITSRLLERQNTQLRQELERLRKQQKQLLKQQLRIRQKNDRQYHGLKYRSEQLRLKSNYRKKQLEQLHQLIGILSTKKREDPHNTNSKQTQAITNADFMKKKKGNNNSKN